MTAEAESVIKTMIAGEWKAVIIIVLTPCNLVMIIIVLWSLMPCNLVDKYQTFGGKFTCISISAPKK